MRVTICGHAALYIETSQHRILIDPCFANTLFGGVLAYNPPRQVNLDQMPTPTLLVVTHGHFDHWHPDSLVHLSREIPVLTALDSHLVRQLQALGFNNVTPCAPWTLTEWGTTRLLTTPSDHDEPEFGVAIQDETGAFWHMADAEVTPEISQQVLQEFGAIDLISVKYQPVVRASMGYQRNRGSAFDKAEVLTWLETACACNPKMVFPYASGLCFQGRHAWFNRYAFPLSPEEVVQLLQKRLGDPQRAIAVSPGDIIILTSKQLPQYQSQTSPFLRSQPAQPIVWEPVDTQTLAGLLQSEHHQQLKDHLEELFRGSFQDWLTQETQSKDSGWHWLYVYDVIWQCVVHTSPENRLVYWIDFRSNSVKATLGEHPAANFFTHLSGQGLYEVLTGKHPAQLFWLSGDARSYEKVMGVRNSDFWTLPDLPPEDSFCDPLTYYLRVSPFPILCVSPPLSNSDTISNPSLEVLLRRGENDDVIRKKVLLAYLSLREAARIGLQITPEAVQLTSNQFRSQFGLDQPNTIENWLKTAGLSVEDFTTVMQDFTAVLRLEEHYAQRLNPLCEKHRRVGTARTMNESSALKSHEVGEP